MLVVNFEDIASHEWTHKKGSKEFEYHMFQTLDPISFLAELNFVAAIWGLELIELILFAVF